MIMADSSVWIDLFRGNSTPQAEKLVGLIQSKQLVVGDLVLAEVLQGYDSDREFNQALRLLTIMPILSIGGEAIAIEAARNYRTLRTKGITVRKAIDTLIATRCIVDGHALLYSDRDFDPFVEHLGLVSGMEV
jgi:predicted nucleic acid-binding protein